MRLGRSFAWLAVGSMLVTLVAPACQEPTQVTVDIHLETARCDEIHGTAITVGIEPFDTQERVKSRFPTGQTSDCDPATTEIGTLVITPNDDDDHGAVVVVTAFGAQRDPTACQPPGFHDCIVARRRFSFTKHKRLMIPITIDPTCVNVPCDAFSTCRKGTCVDSEVDACENASCPEAGELADGGVDPTKITDATPPDSGGDVVTPTDGSNDTGSDANTDSATDAADDGDGPTDGTTDGPCKSADGGLGPQFTDCTAK